MSRCKDIIDELQSGLDQSIAFFNSLSPEQLNLQIYQEGARWTALQVAAHFITIERSMHWLFKNILSGGDGSPKDFDVDRFNKHQTAKLDGIPLVDLLEQFKQVRHKTIALVESMSDSDLDREAHHAYHGHGRLERFIRWAYEHNRIHQDEILKVVQGFSK